MRKLKFRFIFLIGCLSPTFTTSGESDRKTYSESLAKVNVKEHAYQYVGGLLKKEIPHWSQPRISALAQTIVDESRCSGFDPLFVLAVIKIESNFDYEAISPTGAKGIMQIIASTFLEQRKREWKPQMDIFSSIDNVIVGIGYLHYLGKTFRRPTSVLLAYNQGPRMATLVLSGQRDVTDEGGSYGPKAMTQYKKLLKDYGLDPTRAELYWRSPERTLLFEGYWYNGGNKTLQSIGLPSYVGN